MKIRTIFVAFVALCVLFLAGEKAAAQDVKTDIPLFDDLVNGKITLSELVTERKDIDPECLQQLMLDDAYLLRLLETELRELRKFQVKIKKGTLPDEGKGNKTCIGYVIEYKNENYEKYIYLGFDATDLNYPLIFAFIQSRFVGILNSDSASKSNTDIQLLDDLINKKVTLKKMMEDGTQILPELSKKIGERQISDFNKVMECIRKNKVEFIKDVSVNDKTFRRDREKINSKYGSHIYFHFLISCQGVIRCDMVRVNNKYILTDLEFGWEDLPLTNDYIED